MSSGLPPFLRGHCSFTVSRGQTDLHLPREGLACPVARPAGHGAGGGGAASPGVVDAVVERLAAPERVRVVKLEEVDASAGVGMGPGVHLLVAVPAVHWDDHRLCRASTLRLPASQPLHIIPLTCNTPSSPSMLIIPPLPH
ncbi:hypothetical protein E2C01_013303 [Portunus trituberculatus]|uniref:Uncharacterized protein n=1 Tax=Portunus trituberculatus TaxID=210409 RepID=A0A5B7DFW2_PORTR|nr:hypothetical protein [Portunus trituberculatus]